MPRLLIAQFIASAVVLGSCLPSVAGSLRASFLRDAAAVRDTVTVLRNAGYTAETTRAFERAVERYYLTAFTLDLSRFPKLENGFYAFDSPSNLVAALPHQLSKTEHAYDFNCFDTVVLLAGESLRTSLRPDDISAPFLVPHTPTNGGFAMRPQATARDAFTLLYPWWYREATDDASPRSLRDARISLTAALFRCHVLPDATTEVSLAGRVMDALKASWKRDGMRFPDRAQIVLCHEVSLPQHWFVTVHCGMLFPRKR